VTVPVRVHHIGITVSNLDRSLEFYRDVFGLDPGMIFNITSGPRQAAALDLPEHTQRVALMPVGDFVVELIEFTPTRRDFDMRQDDVGYAYMSFGVNDLEEVYARLTERGLKFNSEPMVSADIEPVAGSKFCILKDPDGKNIEFIQIGPGLSIESLRAGAARGDAQERPYVLEE
jgi:catechol 2,3-dioxygenase-like lactoylglutathione lyase family enzyme